MECVITIPTNSTLPKVQSSSLYTSASPRLQRSYKALCLHTSTSIPLCPCDHGSLQNSRAQGFIPPRLHTCSVPAALSVSVPSRCHARNVAPGLHTSTSAYPRVATPYPTSRAPHLYTEKHIDQYTAHILQHLDRVEHNLQPPWTSSVQHIIATTAYTARPSRHPAYGAQLRVLTTRTVHRLSTKYITLVPLSNGACLTTVSGIHRGESSILESHIGNQCGRFAHMTLSVL